MCIYVSLVVFDNKRNINIAAKKMKVMILGGEEECVWLQNTENIQNYIFTSKQI